MKKTFNFLNYFLITIVLITTGCSSDSGDGKKASSCAENVTALNITQSGNKLNFNITAASALYYEISIGSTSSGGTSPENGQRHQTNDPTGSIEIGNYNSGSYLVYARTVCGDGKYGEWYGPKPLTIVPFCETPYDLSESVGTFFWGYPYTADNDASNYQVQYGPQGFTLGTGTSVTVNGNMYTDAILQAGTSYDFYVRAYCINNVGYGNWAGPYTFIAEESQDICGLPSNIYKSVRNVTLTTLNWSINGEHSFEYCLTGHGNPVPTTNIYPADGGGSSGEYSLTVGNTYDFYVRTVCSNGNRTNWVKYVFTL